MREKSGMYPAGIRTERDEERCLDDGRLDGIIEHDTTRPSYLCCAARCDRGRLRNQAEVASNKCQAGSSRLDKLQRMDRARPREQ